jgi:hypothetical protein
MHPFVNWSTGIKVIVVLWVVEVKEIGRGPAADMNGIRKVVPGDAARSKRVHGYGKEQTR